MSRAIGRGVIVVALLALGLPGCRRGKREPTLVARIGESTILPRASRGEAGASAASTVMRTTTRTMRVGQQERTYVQIEPAAVEAGKRYPLVLVFHGDGGGAASFHAAVPFERATGAEAIVAYPDSTGAMWDLETKFDNRDVAFVEALVHEEAARLPIDESRVFLTGYSSGGFFANVVACQKSGLVRAIASNAGGAPYKQALLWPNGYTRCPGQGPVAAMALHGREDLGVTLDSGRFSASYWAYVNGCNTSEMETTGYGECRAYRGCPAGKEVVFCEVPTLGHWVWDQAPEASWGFFQRR